MNKELEAKAACEVFIVTVKDLYKFVGENQKKYDFKIDQNEIFEEIKDLYDKRVSNYYLYLEEFNKTYAEEFALDVANLLFDIGVDTISIGKELSSLNMEIINEAILH